MMLQTGCAPYAPRHQAKKNQVVLTPIGKITVWGSKFFPRLVTRLEYKFMAQEPDSPLRS